MLFYFLKVFAEVVRGDAVLCGVIQFPMLVLEGWSTPEATGD